jgi:ComF family protein
MKFFDLIVNALFPNKCISCGKIIESEDFICDYCLEMMKTVDLYKICKICGLPKKECQCKVRVFHFIRAVAPYENDGIAREAMYRYKFGRITQGANFFAFEMAKTVQTVYNDIKFDGIAYVPMHPIKFLRRGFNQSELLSLRLGEILNLKVYDRLLATKFFRKSQHRLSLKERFNNVKGMYKTNYKVTGKTILLVDDIKTTGATLDECAKQLLCAGANEVYCVCGLITKYKKGEK